MTDPTGEDDKKNPAPPRDIADFHLRWREFRPHAVAAQANSSLSAIERETLHWLIALSDRVGSIDLKG
jgi:hypothetical protein